MKQKTAAHPRPLGNGFLPTCAAACYGAVIAARNIVYDLVPFLSSGTQRPAISIGGIHAGGTGKTPMTMLVGTYLAGHD